MTIVTRRSPLTGIEQTRDINVTPEALAAWERGAGLIQELMPHLSPSDREWLMTGYTEEDWDKIFPPEELEAAEREAEQFNENDDKGIF